MKTSKTAKSAKTFACPKCGKAGRTSIEFGTKRPVARMCEGCERLVDSLAGGWEEQKYGYVGAAEETGN